MHLDLMLVAIGAMICLIPVGFGILIANWKLHYVEERRHPSVTDMIAPDELLAEEPPHDHCNCAACTFWFEWHRTMA